MIFYYCSFTIYDDACCLTPPTANFEKCCVCKEYPHLSLISNDGIRSGLSNCVHLVADSLKEYKLISGQPSASFAVSKDLLTTILISGEDANDFEFEKLTIFAAVVPPPT